MPSISAAAHPVRRIAQRDNPDTLLGGDGHRPVGGKKSIENAGTIMTIVDLDNAELLHDGRLCIGVDPTALQIIDKARHTIQTMRVDPVATRFGMYPCAGSRIVTVHAGPDKCLGHHLINRFKRDACHEYSPGLS